MRWRGAPPAERQAPDQESTGQRARGVGDQVVDVEQPVRAGVERPDPGRLGQLDRQRDSEPEQHRAGRVARERAERDEQRDVESELDDPAGAAERHQLRWPVRADSPWWQRKQHVGDEPAGVEQAREPGRERARGQFSAQPVLARREGREQQRGQRQRDQRRDDGGQYPAVHPDLPKPTVSATRSRTPSGGRANTSSREKRREHPGLIQFREEKPDPEPGFSSSGWNSARKQPRPSGRRSG
ncbi:hypothetical protein GCM10010470_12520 [Saccharopolyspora taberi]|uniref:Uncharacterized protein n=1 Tax=Saccharopolyspora taberi TaxID=60895 RepID=A0ABN3V6A5_9PSEU